MSDEIVFYTHPMSRGRVARWMLEELGVPYRTEILDYAGSMKGSDYLGINPMGKVPAIRFRGVVVTECAAIVATLAEAFPESGLSPAAGDPLRGTFLRWMFFSAGPMEAAIVDKVLGVVVSEEMTRMVGYGSYAKVLDTIEGALSKSDYLVGDGFTAADLYVGSQIGWGLGFGTVERRPVFEAYWDRIKDRPAAVRARAIDDALLGERQAASSAH